MSTKLKALLATGRISNLPTVWCNCLAAALILLYLNPLSQQLYFSDQEFPIGTFYLLGILLLISTSLIYVGGCFLGDAIDAKFDLQHRPTRPIPSGIFNQRTIMSLAAIMLIIGSILPLIFHYLQAPNHLAMSIINGNKDYGWQQITIVPYLFLAVVLYSLLHKKSSLYGLPLIGLCRFFLVLFGASIAAWLTTTYLFDSNGNEYVETQIFLTKPIIIYASAVCIYTIAFASVARTESSNSPITWRNLLRYTMLALPLTVLFTNQSLQVETITALVIYAIWLSYAFAFLSKNKGNYVSKCLAGFCLLDACFVAQFGWIWVVICLILFLSALALQKIAPAT
ncbi:MAG: hypothetical protein ACI9E1_001581 [Cryomorphaceae bacterium]|jgi:hypothetical protein